MDIREISREISRLEGADTTYTNVTKLAMLYAVKDGLSGCEPQPQSYSYSVSSEFLSAVNGKPVDKVFEILDEHMEAVKAIFPKEYRSVLSMINKIGDV